MSTEVSEVRQKLIWGIVTLALVWLGAASLLVFLKSKNRIKNPSPFWKEAAPEGSVLATFGAVPDFSLTERSGEAFSKSELLGKTWIADFIFTSCPGQCPLMSAKMRHLQDLFPAAAPLRFVSFTVDPKRDTPEVLGQYADRFAAEKDRWFFLTGPPEELERVEKGFYMHTGDDPNMHSVRFALVDQKGGIRGFYDVMDPEGPGLKQLIYDTKILFQTE